MRFVVTHIGIMTLIFTGAVAMNLEPFGVLLWFFFSAGSVMVSMGITGFDEGGKE